MFTVGQPVQTVHGRPGIVLSVDDRKKRALVRWGGGRRDTWVWFVNLLSVNT